MISIDIYNSSEQRWNYEGIWGYSNLSFFMQRKIYYRIFVDSNVSIQSRIQKWISEENEIFSLITYIMRQYDFQICQFNREFRYGYLKRRQICSYNQILWGILIFKWANLIDDSRMDVWKNWVIFPIVNMVRYSDFTICQANQWFRNKFPKGRRYFLSNSRY